MAMDPTNRLTPWIACALRTILGLTIIYGGVLLAQDSEAASEAFETPFPGVEVEVILVTEAFQDHDSPGVVMTTATGSFSPDRHPQGTARILLVDDDAQGGTSGPYIEATHIVTALHDGGYIYDVFRAGSFGGDKQIPAGDDGLSLLDDYEVIIWYSGHNKQIFTSDEVSVIEDYLDGRNGTQDGYSTNNRNVIQMTALPNRLCTYSSSYCVDYLHAAKTNNGTDHRETSIEGVDGSIFDGMEFSYYRSNPPPATQYEPADSSAQGLLYLDRVNMPAELFIAIQYPETASGLPYASTYKAILLADEIGNFDQRSDRATFFATILDWMGVAAEPGREMDVGIGGLTIPNHSEYWRAVEADVPLEFEVLVTNYGSATLSHATVRLRLFSEFGRELLNLTYDSRAFGVAELPAGGTWEIIFNHTNNAHQMEYNGFDPAHALDVAFTTAGLNLVAVEIVHASDQLSANDYIQADVGVARWVDNAELPENELGAPMIFGDTDVNGNESLDHVNVHRAHSYDWDDDGDYPHGESEGGGTDNKTRRSVYHQGEYAFSMFNRNGWYKNGADPDDCDHSTSGGRDNCPKFTPEPYQDDYSMTPPMDLRGMETAVLGILFTGRMEPGDYWRMQISKDGVNWTTLISDSSRYNEGAWHTWGGSNTRYQGYVLSNEYYGRPDTGSVQLRWLTDADEDNVTESCNGDRCTPYMGMFVDEIVLRGDEHIIRDIAIAGATVRAQDFIIGEPDSYLEREVNLTLHNLGSVTLTGLMVEVAITDENGTVAYHDYLTIPGTLAGNSSYGAVGTTGHENETALFLNFTAPAPGNYVLVAKADMGESIDQVPGNNLLRHEFRVNTLPVANITTIDPSPSNEGHPVSFSGSGDDSDGEVVAYWWHSNLDGVLSYSTSFTLGNLSSGDHMISFRVQDDDGMWSLPATDNLHVNARPNATIVSILPAFANQGEPVIFTGNGSDPDGYIYYYDWWSSIDQFIGRGISLTTTSLSPGNHAITLRVRDNDEFSGWSEEWTIIINALPIARIDEATPSFAHQNEMVYFIGKGIDSEGEVVGYEWISDPDGFLSDAAAFAITNLSPGDHIISFRVRDDAEAWSAAVSIELHINARPQASIAPLSAESIYLGDRIKFSGSGDDPDGFITGYRWRSDRDGNLGEAREFDISNLSVGRHNISLEVQDDDGAWSSRATVPLEVRPRPDIEKGRLPGTGLIIAILVVATLAARLRRRP